MADSDNDDQAQILIAIEKYMSLMVIELKDYISKYKGVYENICSNTKEHFLVLDDIVNDFSSEINSNTTHLYEIISKLNLICDDLPKIEEFYGKVKEMRIGLEKTLKLVKSRKL